MAADGGDPASIITQVSRDEDSYAPCPAPISSKGSINTTTTSNKRGLRSFCVCQWLFSCFRSDETTPINSIENEQLDNNPVVSSENALLPPLHPSKAGRKCVVIDLDETLVHSSFRPVPSADFVVSVDIEGVQHQVYVQKRPHVDEFLRRMGEMFECVLFTASLAKYAHPVTDLLDKWNTFDARLFRESCVYHRGNYVKDLSKLGRDITQCCIIDNSPQSYMFHPDNAIPVTSWFDDPDDTELLDLIPFFEALEKVDNVLTVLGQSTNSQTDESRTATPPTANYAQQT